MIDPRRTRLLRTPDLRSFQRTIVAVACPPDVVRARACAVLVPSRAAAAQLSRTIEDLLLGDAADPGRPARSVVVFPDIVTRDEWYGRLHARLGAPAPYLTEVEREVMARAAARDAIEAGAAPPFALRPGLVTELLALYDEIRRQTRTLNDFERIVGGELEPSLDLDRGARRLLLQTRFLAATYRAYQRRVEASGGLDEHGLRARLLSARARDPLRHVVVTVADRAADPAGLWPADFDVLARLPDLAAIDVVATEAVLAAGFHERLHAALPEIEEVRVETSQSAGPILVAPEGDAERLSFTRRDREEELAAVARDVKALAPPGAGPRYARDGQAIVFQRRLPYLYLASRVFTAAGVPYQASDALPLAAEPFAAALDLVLAAVASAFTRASLVGLLRSPHFTFGGERGLAAHEIDALDRALQGARFLGGVDRLAELADAWTSAPSDRPEPDRRRAARAAQVAAELAGELAPLSRGGPASRLLDALLGFLRAHAAPPPPDASMAERHERARAAVVATLDSLRDAHRRHDDPILDAATLASSIRRWIEGQTFAPWIGAGGLQLVDAACARYGRFDAAWIVGLVETDWPDRQRRSIFYPASLLGQLGWPREADRLRAARAAFHDLLRLPARRVALSTFLLEHDAIVGPSSLLEDLDEAGLAVEREPADRRGRVSVDEALALDPLAGGVVSGPAAAWLRLRVDRSPADAPAYRGFAGPGPAVTYRVSAVERYLDCPFKYFAAHVLGLGEELDDEPTMSPRERGRFLHLVFQRFFEAWQEAGRGSIGVDDLEAALDLVHRTAEPLLRALPALDQSLERARLFGSPVASGVAERLLRLEAESVGGVLERLLEWRIDGDVELAGEAGSRRVSLRGTADRIDLRADGTLRVLDYKLGAAPAARRAVQLPVYGACAEQRLAGRHGRTWRVGAAEYIAFRDPRTQVPLAAPGTPLRRALAEGQARCVAAIDRIESGEFPPRPADLRLCAHCAYPTVCRKDYVGDD